MLEFDAYAGDLFEGIAAGYAYARRAPGERPGRRRRHRRRQDQRPVPAPTWPAFPDVEVRFVADLDPELARAAGRALRRPRVRHGRGAARPRRRRAGRQPHDPGRPRRGGVGRARGRQARLEREADHRGPGVRRGARRAAEAAGLRLGSAPDTFLGPGLQTVRRAIEAGAIGTPLTASVVMQYAGPHRWHPNPDFLYQPGAGPLFDMGPYYLTALTQAFGPITPRRRARRRARAPTRVIGAGPRAGEEIPVGVPTYVAALYEFEHGGVAQATFSFDSPLKRMGVVEIAGTEATLVRAGPERLHRRGADQPRRDDWEPVPVTGVEGGRGIGAVDMARAIRAGGPHRATGRLGLHVLDAMLATATSIETARVRGGRHAASSRSPPSPRTGTRPRARSETRSSCAITSTIVSIASATPPMVNTPTVRNCRGMCPPVVSACSSSRWRRAPTSSRPMAIPA